MIRNPDREEQDQRVPNVPAYVTLDQAGNRSYNQELFGRGVGLDQGNQKQDCPEDRIEIKQEGAMAYVKLVQPYLGGAQVAQIFLYEIGGA